MSFCLQIVLNLVQSGLKVENLLACGTGTLERRLSKLASFNGSCSISLCSPNWAFFYLSAHPPADFLSRKTGVAFQALYLQRMALKGKESFSSGASLLRMKKLTRSPKKTSSSFLFGWIGSHAHWWINSFGQWKCHMLDYLLQKEICDYLLTS